MAVGLSRSLHNQIREPLAPSRWWSEVGKTRLPQLSSFLSLLLYSLLAFPSFASPSAQLSPNLIDLPSFITSSVEGGFSPAITPISSNIQLPDSVIACQQPLRIRADAHTSSKPRTAKAITSACHHDVQSTIATDPDSHSSELRLPPQPTSAESK